jgi:SecD/SecF fusion protein
MRNKSLLWIFVILLTLSVVYVLSFSFVANSYEKKIAGLTRDSLDAAGNTYTEGDSLYTALYKKALRDSADAEAYPLVGHSYNYLREHQLNLGLDLKGGMSVILEVSIPELFVALSDKNQSGFCKINRRCQGCSAQLHGGICRSFLQCLEKEQHQRVGNVAHFRYHGE